MLERDKMQYPHESPSITVSLLPVCEQKTSLKQQGKELPRKLIKEGLFYGDNLRRC